MNNARSIIICFAMAFTGILIGGLGFTVCDWPIVNNILLVTGLAILFVSFVWLMVILIRRSAS